MACLHLWTGLRVVSVQIYIGRLDSDLAPLRHGITCIDYKIHNYLLNLTWIYFDQSKVGSEHGCQAYILTDQAVEHPFRIADNGVQVQHLWLQHLFAAEGQELVGQ